MADLQRLSIEDLANVETSSAPKVAQPLSEAPAALYVVTYETGGRAPPTSNLSLSVSGFYNVYDHLRSIEFDPVTLLPLRWGNMLRGDIFGVEAWADFKPVHWWRLSAGLDILEERCASTPALPAYVELDARLAGPQWRC